MAKVTGYQIKQSIEQLEIVKASLDEDLTNSETGYKSEKKRPTKEVMVEIWEVEKKIATLQAAQVAFNESVKVDIPGMKASLTLTLAIKFSGPAGRQESQWRRLSKLRNNVNHYSEREEGKEYPEVLVDSKEALEEAKLAAKRKAEISAAIGAANATIVEIGWLSDDLIVR